ncbi:zinc-binding dehydrogenase [Candidatus Poribacteria bacterium]|nr:zinc-binding dehydrogenase [Candidatus Poribacteria bacterium]MYB65208.1 zinc-binding dehydrogenase [Candidatus Poribacteria bacterium]MYF55315.1 zinc-binding dehydrogenase [Candidatus Poribacteria bacterium]MYI94150.1 zinc-binding dehydrogenase [Candidatus Poribacteria bacterium]
MKAGQIVAPHHIEIIDIEKPNISDYPDGTVMIKTLHSAICGSDMPHFVLENLPERYPLGHGLSIHEAIGVITESKSDKFKEGDEVLALPRHIGACAEYFLSNEDVTIPLVEYDRKDCILMAQPLGTVVWACRKLGNLINLDTVVIGQGPMGLLITFMLSNLGAKTVITTDLFDFRLDVSKQMRATHTVNAATEDLVEKVRDITDSRMADLVVEVVGHQTETINTCLKLLKREGTLLAFGVPDDEVYDFHFAEFFRKNIQFIGSVGPNVQNDFPLAMDMIAQGRIDVSPIITHHLPFTEVQKGFEMALHKKNEAIKIVLDY